MSTERRNHEDGDDKAGGTAQDGRRLDGATPHDAGSADDDPRGSDAGQASGRTLLLGLKGPGETPSRTRLAVVGSVALAVLLAGGGGAYLATTASQGDDHAAGAGSSRSADGGNPPPLALDGYTRSGAGTAGESPGDPGSSGIAPGEPDPNGVRGVLYRALEALPDGPSTGQVYRPTGAVGADEVTRLAKALGVAGTPRLSAGTWQVGAGKDGTGPTLRVTQQAPGTWTFDRSLPAGDTCARGKTGCSGDVTGGQAGQPVGESTAKAAAAPVLKALGQDDAELDTDQLMGAVRVVNANPAVGGLPTYGWSTGIRIGTDGTVVGGSGQMLAPVKGATYPVLGADRTLALLNASRQSHVSPGVCPDVLPQDQPGNRSGCAQPPRRTPAKPSVVPVRGATFGLAAHFVAGQPTLVPSWLFEVRPQGSKDSFTLAYPAVDPAYLASDDGAAGSGTSATPGDSSKVHITSYTTSGRSLTVRFYGGVCSGYTGAADETEDKVTVKVTEHPQEPGKACIMIAKEFSRTVTLKQPLDDREVVDGTGATVHQR